ncbi:MULTISPECIES: hypothetical protein [unclassified Viridibacillus]|uniref:hypothetical protein n=1 Tax=unclassified Viridibacillus TaxID=2617942 RepID=UPI00096BF50F|nr:hypothetical protein [Viridibacillus sp. FSL H7-0596]OMC82711.1 hypothetical protein BK128_19970 [Viridibacillus sp. FSL H7-0596]
MKKIFSLLLFLSFSLFFLTVFAIANDKPSPYEKIYPEIGYKTVVAASNEFAQHYNEKLELPLRVPPISFTHYFGRFSEYDHSFEVVFINDQASENHYKIDIRPIEAKVPIRKKYILDTLKLKNGNEATLMRVSDFNVLVFERGKWQYMLNIDKRVSHKVTTEILVEIANSIDYPNEKEES